MVRNSSLRVHSFADQRSEGGVEGAAARFGAPQCDDSAGGVGEFG
jgi:hypothetical protein